MLDITRLLFKDGIQLNGLPASPAEFTDAYLPFHSAGRPFHRFQPHPRRLNTPHRHLADGRFVSVPDPKLSPCAFTDAAVQRVGRSFLRCLAPEAVRQLTSPIDNEEVVGNKNFGKKDVMGLLWRRLRFLRNQLCRRRRQRHVPFLL